MEELRKARDPLSAVIGMQSAAAILRGPLSGSDRNLLHLCPPELWGAFVSTSPSKSNKNSPVMRPGHAREHGGPKHLYLYSNWSQLWYFVFSSRHVLKGTRRPILSKHLAFRAAGRAWNMLLYSPVQWSNNQWGTRRQPIRPNSLAPSKSRPFFFWQSHP